MAQRADTALAQRGLCRSRTQAKTLIAEGKVLCNGVPLTRPAAPVEEADVLTVTELPRFVGRGGEKLAGAFEVFPLSVTGCCCLDVGASTGGFTDCMLCRGAARVYAVDVGHDQLAPSLREDARVVCMEGTDIRQLSALPEQPVFCGIDVSFISLRLVLPAVYGLLAPGADCIALIKPQFEAGRAHIGKGGIVRSAQVHARVVEDVLHAAQDIGFSAEGVCQSPVQGGDGNTEFLAHLKKPAVPGSSGRVV